MWGPVVQNDVATATNRSSYEGCGWPKSEGLTHRGGAPHGSAHGVRKAGATVASENGATETQLVATFGWDDATQAVNYVRDRGRKKLTRAGMHLLIPTGE